jgi:ABC-type Zn uptake system ZnuABC Zn-binding protein ZnuA
MHNSSCGRLALALFILTMLVPGMASARYSHKWTQFQEPNRVKVATSVPALAEITREIGGNKVSVVSITKAGQNGPDLHIYKSMVETVEEADMVVRAGADQDPWVEKLLAHTHNVNVIPGGRGYVDCSIGVIKRNPADNRTEVGGRDVDSLLLDPLVRKAVAQDVMNGLITVDHKDDAYFRRRLQALCHNSDEVPVREKQDSTLPPHPNR